MTNLPPFEVFQKAENPENSKLRILSFDPGEVVGWAVFQGGILEVAGQVRTTEFTWSQLSELNDLLVTYKPDVVVYESYRVYSWKTDDHAWNEVHTAQIIGIIRYLCILHDIPYNMQTAQIAKQFCTDEKLTTWGFWKKGQKHARDAIRHSVYFALFGSVPKLWTRKGTFEEPKKK